MHENLEPPSPQFTNLATLEAGLGRILTSPRDAGRLEMIVIRPEREQRHTPPRTRLSAEGGVEGDHWQRTCSRKLPDGSPHPEVQITIMNVRCLELLTADRARWPLAGDNLLVDLDLSATNLQPGDRLRIGATLIEITEPPHDGCAKFSRRFGEAALKFVNSERGKQLRLRGVHARVIEPGEVAVGDRVEKVPAQ